MIRDHYHEFVERMHREEGGWSDMDVIDDASEDGGHHIETWAAHLREAAAEALDLALRRLPEMAFHGHITLDGMTAFLQAEAVFIRNGRAI